MIKILTFCIIFLNIKLYIHTDIFYVTPQLMYLEVCIRIMTLFFNYALETFKLNT